MDRVEQIAAALAKGGGFGDADAQQSIEVPQQQEQPPAQAEQADQSAQQATQEPARQSPAPVPYERFKETRQELKSLRREKERLERELALAQQSRTQTEPKGDETSDWLADIFGPDTDANERRTGSRDTAGPAARHEDPVLQAIKDEYADRQLAQTLERFGHVPEEVMLAGLAQGLSPDKVEAAFLHLSHMMGRTAGNSARPTPPPRPASGARPSTPPSVQRQKLPEESSDRVDFVAKMLEQRGLR